MVILGKSQENHNKKIIFNNKKTKDNFRNNRDYKMNKIDLSKNLMSISKTEFKGNKSLLQKKDNKIFKILTKKIIIISKAIKNLPQYMLLLLVKTANLSLHMKILYNLVEKRKQIKNNSNTKESLLVKKQKKNNKKSIQIIYQINTVQAFKEIQNQKKKLRIF